MRAAIKAVKHTLVLFTAVEDFDIMELDVHIAQAIMSTRNGHKCKVIPIMYDISPAKVSEITAENKNILHNHTESAVFIADGRLLIGVRIYLILSLIHLSFLQILNT